MSRLIQNYLLTEFYLWFKFDTLYGFASDKRVDLVIKKVCLVKVWFCPTFLPAAYHPASHCCLSFEIKQGRSLDGRPDMLSVNLPGKGKKTKNNS